MKITTRKKAYVMLSELEENLEFIQERASSFIKELSSKYKEITREILKNIFYIEDIAIIRNIKDSDLGNVKLKEIRRFTNYQTKNLISKVL